MYIRLCEDKDWDVFGTAGSRDEMGHGLLLSPAVASLGFGSSSVPEGLSAPRPFQKEREQRSEGRGDMGVTQQHC